MLIYFFYRKFNKLSFLSEQFFCISFRDIGEPLKKCTFFPRLRLERNRFWGGLLVCSMGSRNKHVYQNSDLYRLMFFFFFKFNGTIILIYKSNEFFYILLTSIQVVGFFKIFSLKFKKIKIKKKEHCCKYGHG